VSELKVAIVGGGIPGTRREVVQIENVDRLDHGRVVLLVERGC